MSIPLGPINPNDPAIEVYRSLPKMAPWYLLLLARLSGQMRYAEYRGNVLVIWREFRGKQLLESFEYLPPSKCGTITIWKDGTHKMWSAADAHHAAQDHDWLVNI